MFADTGDLWAQIVNPSAGYSALTLALGSLLDAIHVAFVPSAPHEGAVVRSFIAIDTFNLVSLAGDEATVSRPPTGSANRP